MAPSPLNYCPYPWPYYPLRLSRSLPLAVLFFHVSINDILMGGDSWTIVQTSRVHALSFKSTLLIDATMTISMYELEQIGILSACTKEVQALGDFFDEPISCIDFVTYLEIKFSAPATLVNPWHLKFHLKDYAIQSTRKASYIRHLLYQ